MADMCPNCGEAGVQFITHFGQCLYCGKKWDLTTGKYMEDPPVTLGGGVVSGAGDAMTTTETLGGGTEGEEEEDGEVDLNAWTKAELQASLDSQGIEYPSSATKAELIELFG